MTTPTTAEQIDAVLSEFEHTAATGTGCKCADCLAVRVMASAILTARATIARLEGEKRNLALKLQQVDEELAVDGYYNTVEKAILVRAQANRADAAERRVEALTALVAVMEQMAAQAYEHWDADRDAKVGKILGALASHRPGYSITLDAARQAATEADAALAAASGAKEGR